MSKEDQEKCQFKPAYGTTPFVNDGSTGLYSIPKAKLVGRAPGEDDTVLDANCYSSWKGVHAPPPFHNYEFLDPVADTYM